MKIETEEKCALCGEDIGRCEEDISFCAYCGKGPLCEDCGLEYRAEEIDDYILLCDKCFMGE
jgi:hypothetical protein